MTDRQLITVTTTLESSIIFAARMGWIPSTAPKCSLALCSLKNTTSYLRKKTKRKRGQNRLYYYYWNYRCCNRLRSVLHNTMFFNSTYGPPLILEILWKLSSRTPVSMIPRLIFGSNKSEYYSWVVFFRDVAG